MNVSGYTPSANYIFLVNQGNMEAAHPGVQLTVKMHSGQQFPTERK